MTIREKLDQAWITYKGSTYITDIKQGAELARFIRLLDAEAWLDAAMMLVPDKAVTTLAMQQRWRKPVWTWGLNDGHGVTHFGDGDTPAEALLAAVEKARQ